MSNYWAIAVGINHYQFLQPLHFAQPDAQSLCESLVSDAGFLPDHCLLLTDTSPDLLGHSTDPNHENLQYWIKVIKEKIQPEDGLWCYFSGYGICVDGEDFLLPIDADPNRVKETGFSVRSLFQALRSLPTQKIFVLLDFNRSSSVSNEKIGSQTAALAREYGIPTMLSCRPEQFSHEAPAYNHGLFTQALLEGLRSHQCSTLSALEDFLKLRLPELCDHSDRPLQDPVLVVSDPDQLYQVIMPVNWAETDAWTAADSNPFAIEDDLYLTSESDSPFGDFATPSTIMGATAEANQEEIPEQFRLDPVEVHDPAPIPDLTVSDPDLTVSDPAPDRTISKPVPDLTLSDPMPDHAPSPIPPETDGQDQMFWERLLFGGSAILLVLLLGVLFRNWSAFMGGQQQTAKTQNAPTVVASPSPSPATESSAEILNEARSLIRPTLASDASKAIDRARTIPPSDPLYAQAQQDIDRWSRNILDIARQRAAQKQFQQAIAAAQLVPKDRPDVYAEAQKAIQQWRRSR
ncbi:putative peptidase C14 [Leptolyngbya sp. NIES-3755]|nr:putative peptidase C14 [Leptolyngbya sp. NIES-3755]